VGSVSSGMDKTFREWDPEQSVLFPPSVLDLVPPGHPAHFVREVVRNELDLSGIYAAYVEGRGQPPYDPRMMVALLLYAYSRGVRSSRKIAQGCEERVDFMAVTGMQRPDHDTVNEFRRRHLKAIEGLFTQVLELCAKAGLVKLGHVAIDGTKIQANASKHKAMSYGRMEETRKRLRGEVRRWLEEAEAVDRAEDEELGKGRRGDEMPDWVKDKKLRAEKIAEAKKALEAEARERAEAERKAQGPEEPGGQGRSPSEPDERPDAKAQRNFTDPESRILKTKDCYVQGYNAQAAVDAASQVIVAQEVGTQSDVQRLVAMVEQVRENTGRLPDEVSADAGYCSEGNLLAMNKRRVAAYIATGRQKHGTGSATANAQRRRGPWTSAMRTKLKRAGHRSRYRLRKQTVEPVFGQMKECRGFRRFLLRGLEKVRGEWSLACIVHNLLKLFKASPATA
jgi:transposase